MAGCSCLDQLFILHLAHNTTDANTQEIDGWMCSVQLVDDLFQQSDMLTGCVKLHFLVDVSNSSSLTKHVYDVNAHLAFPQCGLTLRCTSSGCHRERWERRDLRSLFTPASLRNYSVLPFIKHTHTPSVLGAGVLVCAQTCVVGCVCDSESESPFITN